MTDLFESLDKAAVVMLELATASDTVNLDKAVSVFQTVAKYAEQRAKMEPVKPVKQERAKIDDLRARFNGTDGSTPKGRAPRRATALSVVEPSADAGTDGDD